MRRKLRAWLVACACAAGAPALAQAQSGAIDIAQARTLAGNCANCHGTNGRSRGVVPALGGTQAAYFVEQMRQFREGKRPATVMHQLAKGYSDDEVAALAEFFSRQAPAR